MPVNSAHSTQAFMASVMVYVDSPNWAATMHIEAYKMPGQNAFRLISASYWYNGKQVIATHDFIETDKQRICRAIVKEWNLHSQVSDQLPPDGCQLIYGEKKEEKEDRLKQAEEIIERMLDWALANRNSEDEFVRCYSYGSRAIPRVIADAKQFLGEKISPYTEVAE